MTREAIAYMGHCPPASPVFQSRVFNTACQSQGPRTGVATPGIWEVLDEGG